MNILKYLLILTVKVIIVIALATLVLKATVVWDLGLFLIIWLMALGFDKILGDFIPGWNIWHTKYFDKKPQEETK